jgi:hypothetical protein
MTEIRDADASIRGFSAIATLLIFAAAIVIPYVCDRAYRRWLQEIDAFAWLPASIERRRTGYRQKRASANEWAQLISDVLVEVDRAKSAEKGR